MQEFIVILCLVALGFVIEHFRKKKINKLNSKRVKSVNRNIKFALYMLIISLLRVARKVSSGGDIRDVVPTIVFGFLVGFLCLVGLGYALEYFSKEK